MPYGRIGYKYNVFITHPVDKTKRMVMYENITLIELAKIFEITSQMMRKIEKGKSPIGWSTVCNKLMQFEKIPRECDKKNNSDEGNQSV